MTRKVHIIIQVSLLALQVLNAVAPILQGNAKVYALTAISFIEGAVGIINHAFNTDGTPQSVPFVEAK